MWKLFIIVAMSSSLTTFPFQTTCPPTTEGEEEEIYYGLSLKLATGGTAEEECLLSIACLHIEEGDWTTDHLLSQ